MSDNWPSVQVGRRNAAACRGLLASVSVSVISFCRCRACTSVDPAFEHFIAIKQRRGSRHEMPKNAASNPFASLSHFRARRSPRHRIGKSNSRAACPLGLVAALPPGDSPGDDVTGHEPVRGSRLLVSLPAAPDGVAVVETAGEPRYVFISCQREASTAVESTSAAAQARPCHGDCSPVAVEVATQPAAVIWRNQQVQLVSKRTYCWYNSPPSRPAGWRSCRVGSRVIGGSSSGKAGSPSARHSSCLRPPRSAGIRRKPGW